eukprot:2798480-Rhodomonas_salina.1
MAAWPPRMAAWFLTMAGWLPGTAVLLLRMVRGWRFAKPCGTDMARRLCGTDMARHLCGADMARHRVVQRFSTAAAVLRRHENGWQRNVRGHDHRHQRDV